MAKPENSIVRAFLGYKEILVRVLLRMAVQPADVDDILQESLARTLNAENRAPVEHPRSYLYTVARHIVFEERQRRAREVQCEIDEAILASDATPIDEALHHEKMLEIFWQSMSTLPRNHQRAILLRRIYGLSHKQVAKKMGVSLSSVEKYFAQGIRRCEDLMRRSGYGLGQVGIAAGDGGSQRRERSGDTRHDDE